MNKTAIKNFAIWARNKLIADIIYQAGLLGVTEKGIAQPLPQSTNEVQFFDIGTKDYMTVRGKAIRQRNAFVAAIKAKQADTDYASAFRFVAEKVAYTWFNRLIASRFMEVNDYLPGRVRVLSSENPGKAEPDMVTRPFDTDLSFSAQEQDEIMRMKDENKLNELFRMLFIKQCQKLHEILPGLFDPQGIEQVDSYLELLLTISFTDKDGVLWHLVHDIDEDDFNVEKEGQVEIIGWMYQYYNTEPKDQVFANLKKNIKISKDNIPAATQLFTPDWIVRYMVENSLGRLWVEGHPNEELKKNWKYYLEEAEQEPQVQAQLAEIRKENAALRPEEIKVIDPCMGSGHILVYLFDVLVQIYESQGWTQREAAQSIVQNNLYGLDIDDRAAQLAYFAVMMKARQYDRRFLERGIVPHVYAIQESNGINREHSKLFGKGMSNLEKNNAVNQLNEMLDALQDAKEYGSILAMPELDWDLLIRFTAGIDDTVQITLDSVGAEDTLEEVRALVEQTQVMAQKYHAVTTNPPYMGASNMNVRLNQFIKDYYPDYKSDFFSAFMVRCSAMTLPEGYCGFFTPYVWMFIQSYEKLRQYLYNQCTIETLIQFEYSAFEEATVPVCTLAFRNSNIDGEKGCYLRLTDFKGGMETQRQKTIEAINDHECGFYYEQSADNFYKIAGAPVAYWASDDMLRTFVENRTLGTIARPRIGQNTGDNNRFLRLWFEVSYQRIRFGLSHDSMTTEHYKWLPYNKGGEYRRWYGNQDYIVNWEDDGKEIKDFAVIRNHGKHWSRYIQNIENMCKPGVTWSFITSGAFSVRYMPKGFICDVAGSAIFPAEEQIPAILALCNSKYAAKVLGLLNPTLNMQAGNVASIPVKQEILDNNEIAILSKTCIELSKEDWDCYETSWGFSANPLVRAVSTVEQAYEEFRLEALKRFTLIKEHEETLNKIIIEYYGLSHEIEPDIDASRITVHQADISMDIRGLISYAVGCMFGRYSLDVSGLVYAGGIWDASKYTSYQPDPDNCIPITDEAYFEDDIVGRFIEFIRVVFGTETLEENLNFIAKALGNKGNTSREIIRNYFLNDFFKDHCTTYSVTGSGKRPIYWLFDSGKQNGFKALVYMHRWNADTVGNLRVEYLHRMQRVYEKEIERMQDIIDNSRDNREINQASKRREKLVKQLKEARDYDAKIAHVALSRVEIDLDDGVKVNYEKVQKGPDGKSLGILAKI